VDNKHKQSVDESDIEKLVRDAKERSIPVAALVAREDAQLRQSDKENRWAYKDRIWILSKPLIDSTPLARPNGRATSRLRTCPAPFLFWYFRHVSSALVFKIE
jgi:hypothetical protein